MKVYPKVIETFYTQVKFKLSIKYKLSRGVMVINLDL